MKASAIGVVAGTGLNLLPLLDHVEERRLFAEEPGMAAATVSGHEGCFFFGTCGKHRVILQSGRLHFYEGFGYSDVVRPVDALASFGVRRVFFTNAAGGLRPEMRPGDIVEADCVQPVHFRGWPNAPRAMRMKSTIPGVTHVGTYIWVPGPSYETQAEIRALRLLGGAMVGMSTAPEAHRCHTLGLGAHVLSCITNNCCEQKVLSHEHVLEAARRASERMVGLVRSAIDSASGAFSAVILESR